MKLIDRLEDLLCAVHELTASADDKPVLLVDEATFLALGLEIRRNGQVPGMGFPQSEGLLRMDIITNYGKVEIVNKNELYKISNVLNRICE